MVEKREQVFVVWHGSVIEKPESQKSYENGEEKSLGQVGKQKRSWGHRMIWDERKKEERQTGVVAVRVRHGSYAGDVWVVIVRRGGEPWYAGDKPLC